MKSLAASVLTFNMLNNSQVCRLMLYPNCYHRVHRRVCRCPMTPRCPSVFVGAPFLPCSFCAVVRSYIVCHRCRLPTRSVATCKRRVVASRLVPRLPTSRLVRALAHCPLCASCTSQCALLQQHCACVCFLAGSSWQFTLQKNLDHYNGDIMAPVRWLLVFDALHRMYLYQCCYV